jgi:hypothetical protein
MSLNMDPNTTVKKQVPREETGSVNVKYGHEICEV